MQRSPASPAPVPEGYWAGRTAQDKTLFSRFEAKYIVPSERAPAMRRFLQPFVRPDDFAARRPNFTYSVCSLYLDSPELALYYTTVNGIKNRFKLRIRTYDDDPLTPLYCEIKRRINGVIHKRRGRIDREHVAGLLRGRLPGREVMYAASGPALTEFQALVFSVNARPVVKVRYQREAYVSKAGDPVRVTFDTELRGVRTTACEFGLETGEWKKPPVNGVILEIKFTDRYPSWLGDFVEIFQLQRRSVAKYIMCVNTVLAPGHDRPGPPAHKPGVGKPGLPARRPGDVAAG